MPNALLSLLSRESYHKYIKTKAAAKNVGVFTANYYVELHLCLGIGVLRYDLHCWMVHFDALRSKSLGYCWVVS